MDARGKGTSKAFGFGEVEGTISSIAMVVAALISIVLSRILFTVLEQLVMNSLLH